MRLIGVVCLTLLLLTSPWNLAAGEGIHRPYGELLQAHVIDGKVDYQGFKKDEEKLDLYLQSLAQTDLSTLSVDEKLAFYINAYNGYTIKLILDNYKNGAPPSSIKKIGSLFTSPWSITFANIAGEEFSLDTIEHDIIRKQWNEPRIHFAVNCASRSCPPLLSEPYTGALIDTQLEAATRDFLADPEMNYLEGQTLYISSIFKWYSEDFQDNPVQFFLDHTAGDLHEQIRKAGDVISVKYLRYDWSLNSK